MQHFAGLRGQKYPRKETEGALMGVMDVMAAHALPYSAKNTEMLAIMDLEDGELTCNGGAEEAVGASVKVQ